MTAENFKITGMTCTECAKTITKAVKKVPGVKKVNVNISMDSMSLQRDQNVSDQQIIEAVKKSGYGASKVANGESLFSTKPSKTLIVFAIKTALAGLFTIPLWIGMGLNMSGVNTPGAQVIGGPIFGLVVSLIILIIGYQFFVDMWSGIKQLTTNMSFLIVLGSLAAFGLSLYNSIEMNWKYIPDGRNNWHEIYYETIGTIITLVLLGKVFENIAKKSTTSSLKKISQLIPNKSTIVVNNKQQTVDSSQLKINDVVIVKTGDKFPTDGIVISGEGYTNESLISGESKPIKKVVGKKVIAGSVLDNGLIQFKVTKDVKDNTVSQIVNLVSEAQSNDLKIGQLVDKVSAWFVPIVVFIALMSFMGWAIHLQNQSDQWQKAIVNAIAVLVVACPCALGLATPTAVMVGTGKASEAGIIFKNGNQLENLAKLKAVVFDKTGTLTDGKMSLDQIIVLDEKFDLKTIQQYLKSVEMNSQHPIAVSLVNSLKTTKNVKSTYFENITSKGVSGVVNGNVIKIGNVNWLTKNQKILNKVNTLQQQGKTVFVMSVENQVVAIISLSDHLKNDAKQLIQSLNDINIKTIMVTGDNALTANYVAKQLGINEVHSDIPVSEKANFVAALQNGGKTKRGKQIHNAVAMVGDGINDTVALTKADIGITMSSSLDAAIASSDVILVNNQLIDIYKSIIVAKKTYNKIIGNLFWAFIYNSIMLPLAAFGILRPEYSAIAMALSSISVVLNSLLLGIGNITKKPKDIFKWIYNKKKTKLTANDYDEKLKSKSITKNEK